MGNNKHTGNISDELLAAFLDGNVNADEAAQVLRAVQSDPSLREVIEVASSIECDLQNAQEDMLPMAQMAAESNENLCCVHCEAYILSKHGITRNEHELITTARENNWLTDKGTPLHAVGQLLAAEGIMVTRTYGATPGDIAEALGADAGVIAVVDSDKLAPGRPDYEDEPNHAVVITDIDESAGTITLYNPQGQSPTGMQHIPLDDFKQAWRESHNYMARTIKTPAEYKPRPVDLGGVSLTADLLDLREAIAENAHDVWALARIGEGWTYGPVRDDARKQHPDLVPYSALPDSEKEYDRLMAMNTIKLVRKLGFEIVKR